MQPTDARSHETNEDIVSDKVITTGLLRTLALGPCLLGLGAACSSAPTLESVGSTESRLTVADVAVTTAATIPSLGSETSVAWIPGSVGVGTITIGFNANVGMAWATSIDDGQTYSFVSNEKLDATSRSNLFPPAPFVIPNLSDGSRYLAALGDPAVVQTGWPGVVAYFVLAASTTSPPGKASDAVVFTSIDGGRTFGPVTGGSFAVISDFNSSQSGGSGAGVDQPVASYEGGLTHAIWTNWRNGDELINGGGSRNWVRKIGVNPNGTVVLGPAPQVVNVHTPFDNVWALRTKYSTGSLTAYCDPAHRNNLGCAGGQEVLLDVFPIVGPNTGAPNCTSNSTDIICAQANLPCSNTIDVRYYAATSIDQGVQRAS